MLKSPLMFRQWGRFFKVFRSSTTTDEFEDLQIYGYLNVDYPTVVKPRLSESRYQISLDPFFQGLKQLMFFVK